MARPRKTKRKTRVREHYHIYLNRGVDGDSHVANLIERFQAQSKFTDVIRQSIPLYDTLSKGNIDRLLDLFPWIVDKIFMMYGKNDSDDLIEQFRQMMLQEIPKIVPTIAPVTGGLIGAPPPLMPTFDDEDTITLVKDTTSGQKAVTNFLDAALKFQEAQHEAE